MRVEIVLSLELNMTMDEIGEDELRKYIRGSLLIGKRSYLANDPIRVGIGDVKITAVNKVNSSLNHQQSAGGIARAASLTSHERSVIAQKAARARWAKKGAKVG